MHAALKVATSAGRSDASRPELGRGVQSRQIPLPGHRERRGLEAAGRPRGPPEIRRVSKDRSPVTEAVALLLDLIPIFHYHQVETLTPSFCSCRGRDAIDSAQRSGRKQTGVPGQT